MTRRQYRHKLERRQHHNANAPYLPAAEASPAEEKHIHSGFIGIVLAGVFLIFIWGLVLTHTA